MANDTIEFAGDYNLSSIVLHNHLNQGISPRTKGTDIKHLVQELNIYESMFENCLTADMLVNDSVNLPYKGPILGEEYLNFRLHSKAMEVHTFA